MKIFFSSPIRGTDTVQKYLRQIDDKLKKMGLKNIDNLVERLNSPDYYKTLDVGGKEAHTAFFAKTIEGIKSADITIFECSVPSLGIGFQIEKSLFYNKPTIVLYYKNNIPHFLAGTQNDKLLMYQYDEGNLDGIVETAIEEASHASDKRFNFFISPSLLTYLEEESTRQGITKSAFIRHLILDHRKKHK